MDFKTILLNLEDVIGDGFARYSKYIIQDRAIPDARDGLKPVQRRILYAMYEEGNTFNKPYRKSAKSVGVIMGNYHPHGDSSIYDAMVRLSQSFKMNHQLIDMHGNNGSVDGDSAAAMRYTEARLSKMAMELLDNVDKNTVIFAPNFDDTELEPIVLPAYYPNLLVNGAMGISAGYATDIPSHNLGEIIDATITRIRKPTCRLETLLDIVQGPDFCTGGIIQGKDQIKKAYETGKGRIVIRSKLSVNIVKNIKVISISEIPYDVNKADLVRKLEEIKYDKVIDGIINVRDESDRNGLSIVIELKKETNEELVLNYLYKNTNLQVYYSFNMVAIVKKTPRQLGLIELLDTYIDHQKEVLINKTNYELEISKKRLHIVEGLINAVDVIDEIIEIIKKSANRRDSITNLMSRFTFTEAQSEAIVDLRLYRLSNTDITTLQEENERLQALIRQLSLILSDPTVLNDEIINKLKSVKKEYAFPRKSIIEDEIQEISISKEQLIQNQEVMISISKTGYIKRSSLRSYQSSNEEIVRKEDDFILDISSANTLDKLLVFFDSGLYAFLPVYEIQEGKWKDIGKHISNYVDGLGQSNVVATILINDFKTDHLITTITRNGMIKKSYVKDLETTRYTKALKYHNVKKNDLVASVLFASNNDDIIISTSKGYINRYALNTIADTGLRTAGVKAIKLVDDVVASAINCDAFTNNYLYMVFENGNTKRLRISEIELSNRNVKGVLFVKNKKVNPDLVLKTFLIKDNVDIVLIDSTYEPTLLKTYDTPLSIKNEGLKKSLKLAEKIYVIEASITKNLTLNPIKVEEREVFLEEDDLDIFEYEDNQQLTLEFEEPQE